MQRLKNSIFINLLIFCSSFAIIFLIGEVTIRTYRLFHRNIPFHASPINYRADPELGWKGKQIFGNPSSRKYKIFIVGDSVTHGCGVEEDFMYYDVIKRNLNAEMFIYGGVGYGTLQEYMVIDILMK